MFKEMQHLLKIILCHAFPDDFEQAGNGPSRRPAEGWKRTKCFKYSNGLL